MVGNPRWLFTLRPCFRLWSHMTCWYLCAAFVHWIYQWILVVPGGWCCRSLDTSGAIPLLQKNKWNAHRVTVPGLGSSWTMRPPKQEMQHDETWGGREKVWVVLACPASNCGAEICRNSIVERCWTDYFAPKPDSELQHLHLGTMWQTAADGHIIHSRHETPTFPYDGTCSVASAKAFAWLESGLGFAPVQSYSFCSRRFRFLQPLGRDVGVLLNAHTSCAISHVGDHEHGHCWLFGHRKKGAQHVAPSLPGPFSPSPFHGI